MNPLMPGNLTPDDPDDTDFHLLGIPSEDETHALRSRVPFELLATQFVAELRTGKGPSVDLYAKRYPPHAERIRDVFPVLAMLENARIDKEAQSIRRNMPDRFPFTRIGQCELLTELGRGGMGVVYQARDLQSGHVVGLELIDEQEMAADDDLPRLLSGRYRLEATIGHGGMGVVYQARDLQSGHVVAVKILPWRISIVPEWVQRFERESRTAGQLRHKNIVPVFRCGQENGYCYFVMQFVNGIGLDRVIARLQESHGVISVDEIQRDQTGRRPVTLTISDEDDGPQSTVAADTSRRKLTRTSWTNFAKVAIQATQALRAAHAAGILHNDIKPANLLLDAEGRVWVSDFGLSQPIAAAGVKATDRTVAGTLRYMAPERLMGQQSAACDIYSLGATLYELCLQRAAFDHPDREELIRMIMEDRPARPRDLYREIPRGLETIILNCLATHPTDRYASADALLTDLLKFSKGQSVSSTHRATFSAFFQAIRNTLHRKS